MQIDAAVTENIPEDIKEVISGRNMKIVDTYDFITVQLYEGYSHTQYRTQVERVSPHTVLIELIKSLYQGWVVDFSSDLSVVYPSSSVCVGKSKLVIGLANGWAGDGKFLLIQPEQVRECHVVFLFLLILGQPMLKR